jgi:hypothetical protein
MPNDAEYFNNGLYYKIGVHGKAFIWVLDGWIKSAQHVDDVRGFRKVVGLLIEV